MHSGGLLTVVALMMGGSDDTTLRPVPFIDVKVQDAWLLHASVAILVTVVTPTGKVLPLAGILTMSVTLQLLVAVTRKVTLLRLHRPDFAGLGSSEPGPIGGLEGIAGRPGFVDSLSARPSDTGWPRPTGPTGYGTRGM